MNRKFLFLILFLYSLSFSQLYAVQDIDSLLADIYVEHAYNQFESGNYNEAFELSDIALAFSGLSSDGLFIHAVSGRETGRVSDSLRDLSLSIVADSWTKYDETTARVYISLYQFMSGEVESAYINLEPFKTELSRSSFFSEVFIKIALRLQKVDEAVRAAGNRLKVDPYDVYAQLTMAIYNSEWLVNTSRNILEGDPASFYSRELIQSIIRRSTGIDNLLNFYKERWGEDQFYTIAGLADSDSNVIDSVSSVFPDNSSVAYEDLLWGYNLLNTEEQKTSVMSYLTSITIRILYDVNSDSTDDTEAIYTGGTLSDFRFDSNQDGSYDVLVNFNTGKPQKLVLNNLNHTYTFIYRDYPYLIKAVDSGPDYKREYQLIPYSVLLDVLILPDNLIDGIPSVIPDYLIPDDTILTDNSTQKSTIDLNTKNVANFIRLDSDESVERIFESEGTKIIERHFRNSILITIYRDFNTDGIFDTVYNYTDAVLSSVTFDENNNGVVDYMEDYTDGLVRSWDFNEDGIIDTRDSYIDGVLTREISTELNGVFDTSFELSEGNLQ